MLGGLFENKEPLEGGKLPCFQPSLPDRRSNSNATSGVKYLYLSIT